MRTWRSIVRGWRILPGAALFLLLNVAASALAPAQQDSAAMREKAMRALPPGVLLGVVAGYEGGVQFASFPVFAGSPDCGEFTSGIANAFAAGVGFSDGTFFSDRLGLALTLGVASVDGRLVATPNEPLVIVDTTSGGERISPRIDHVYRYNASWSAIRADIGLDYRLADRLSLRPGIWVGSRRSEAPSQSDSIINESTYRFEQGARSRPMEIAGPVTLSRFAFGLYASLAYQLRLTRRLWLVPELTVRGDLASITDGAPWRTLTGGGTIGVMFDVAPPELPPPPDMPPPQLANNGGESPQARPHLEVGLDLYGIDEGGRRLPSATIRIYEVLYRQRTPLLGPIYFDRGSAELPARYIRYTPERSRAFAVDSLAGLDALSLHYQSLNLLGYRMREFPNGMIGLVGSRGKGEGAYLARARAERVRSYLHDAWGIDTGRVTIATAASRARGEDRAAEGRTVTITAGTPALVDPVVLDKLVRDFDPPLIALDPMLDSTTALKEWTIALLYEGKEIGRYSSRDTGSDANVRWQIPDDQADLRHSFLVGELTVEDSSGSRATSRAQAPLTLERTFRIVERKHQDGDRERVSYSLLAFAFNSAEVDGGNRDVVEEIAEGLRSGARVRVVGYTDRTGSDETNDELSRRRAANVAAAIRALLRERGVRGVEIASEGAGYDDRRFDNALPEGRVLAREVEVIVEQKVGAPVGER